MEFNQWSMEEVNYLLELINKGTSFKRTSEAINKRVSLKEKGFTSSRSTKAVARKLDRLKNSSPVESVTTPPLDERWLVLKDLQRKYNEDSKYNAIGLPTKPLVRKILALSDIHFPFSRIDFLTKALDVHPDATDVVINGDIIDGYIFSSFEKDKGVAAIDEFNCAFEFIYMLSQRYPRVFLTSGNHDVRATRSLKRAGYNTNAYGIFNTDLIGRIANGERLDSAGKLIEKVKMDNVFYPATEQWWVQVGKTLFIHPHSRGSAKPGHTVSSWAKKFQERLPSGSFDSVVCGHTHSHYKGIMSNYLLIEQGCLSDYMSYSWQPTAFYHSSAMNGYAVIYQDEDGNTDFNASNFHYLGQLLPMDKPLLGGRL